MKVLIVDDNDDDRKLMRLNLERHGCTNVIEARDGQEGFDQAMAYRPDLIISDALMPRIDGFQLLRRLKAEAKLGNIPFVFHSAVYTGVQDEELAYSLGADAFIAKPKEPEDFWRELSVIIERLASAVHNPPPGEPMEGEKEYLRHYSSVVAAKLEEKVRELEEALSRRKEAEKALRTQFTQFSTIFDSLNALVYVADMDNGKILFMNRYGGILFGDSWEGKTCAEVFKSFQGEHWGHCPKELLVRDNIPLQSYSWESHISVNGRWYQGIDRAIPWTDGRLVRLQIAFDITERKEIERIKDELIAAVSHEMRTPLTSLLGFTEIMRTNELSLPQMKEYLNVIQVEADRLRELIENFLDIQMLKTRHSTAGFLPVNIRTLLEETAASFVGTSLNHRIVSEFAADLPCISADEKLLRRMLELLVSNAIKFSPGGGEVFLRASVVESNIAITVRDQGIGISADELEHIFELFYRVDNNDRRMFGGTGLGLALVKEIALGHGGKVWAESSIGKGSTFYVSLPLNSVNSVHITSD
jgi:signal transduction histidine kinase/DNA-binding response OmpR family regulator